MKIKAFLFGLFLSATAMAETRLTVALNWEHLPRSEPGLETFMQSQTPQGNIYFQRYISGAQILSVELPDGTTCGTSGSKMVAVTLRCGKKDGYFWVTKSPKQNIQAEWVSQ